MGNDGFRLTCYGLPMGGFRKLWPVLAGLPLAGIAVPVRAAEEQDSALPSEPREGEIIVLGERQRDIFAGIVAETEFDENAIAAYGFDSVGELLEQVFGEVDPTGEGPVVLINGRLASSINEIADLPSEALSRIQILPRQAGARVGQGVMRRVVNVVIKPDLRQVTANATGIAATRGDAYGGEGELNLLKLDEGNRASLVLKAKRGDPLYEGDRGIVTEASGLPFDFAGNVLSSPTPGGEIDPALSALAGRATTLVGVPASSARPTLTDFAVNANRANVSDFGRFRTLVSESEVYSANANLTRRFDEDTTLALNARVERSLSDALTGAATALFRVPGVTAFSPFGRDVLVARALGDPLEQSQRATTVALSETLNTRFNGFRATVTANFNHRVGDVASDRDYDLAGLQAAFLAGTRDPFAAIDRALLGTVRSDRARSRSDSGVVQAIVGRTLLALPAGELGATLRLGARMDRFSSSTRSRTVDISRHFERDEQNAQLSLQVPLLRPAGPLGGVVADLTAGVRDLSTIGTLHDYSAGLNWLADEKVSLRATYAVDEVAPPANALSDPIVTIDNFRTFDFVRQETVFVRYVTGGNPGLPVQRRRTWLLGATLEPFAGLDLRLNAEYEREVGRNVFAALPPADARVQLAFPDRYLRDAAGRLIQLDARPITYARDLDETLRWGVDFKRLFGASLRPGRVAAAGGGEDESPTIAPGSGWRVNLNANHTWTLARNRLARRGLAVVDLLAGGALGYGGGQPRHVVQFTSAVYRKGFGLQLNGDWRGETRIRAGTLASPDDVTFASRTLLNARLFANLGPQFPDSSVAKGVRVSLAVTNLLDSKQRVTDGTGATPLRYQPFLLDPLGRTAALSIRKVF